MTVASVDGVLYSEPTFRVTTAVLDHRTPCLGFAIEEAAHVNVWKNRLSELGLPVGPWLRELKRAVIENRPDDYPIQVGSSSKTSHERAMRLRGAALCGDGHTRPEDRLRDRRGRHSRQSAGDRSARSQCRCAVHRGGFCGS